MADQKIRGRLSGGVLLIAIAFVAACVVSFLAVAIGFGHQG